jgi:hypothetical protein
MADPNSLLPPGGGGQMEIMTGGGNTLPPPSNKIETSADAGADAALKPAEQEPNSAEEGVKPAEEGVKPAEQEPNPAEEGVKPAEEGVKPVEEETNSKQTNESTKKNKIKLKNKKKDELHAKAVKMKTYIEKHKSTLQAYGGLKEFKPSIQYNFLKQLRTGQCINDTGDMTIIDSKCWAIALVIRSILKKNIRTSNSLCKILVKNSTSLESLEPISETEQPINEEEELKEEEQTENGDNKNKEEVVEEEVVEEEVEEEQIENGDNKNEEEVVEVKEEEQIENGDNKNQEEVVEEEKKEDTNKVTPDSYRSIPSSQSNPVTSSGKAPRSEKTPRPGSAANTRSKNEINANKKKQENNTARNRSLALRGVSSSTAVNRSGLREPTLGSVANTRTPEQVERNKARLTSKPVEYPSKASSESNPVTSSGKAPRSEKTPRPGSLANTRSNEQRLANKKKEENNTARNRSLALRNVPVSGKAPRPNKTSKPRPGSAANKSRVSRFARTRKTKRR